MNSNAELNVIATLNLDPIKRKLMHKESGEGWSLKQVNEVELEYRRFLHLLKLFPNEQVAPRFDVDIFWHYHILDTMKYAVDCEQIFGYFLHHYPYSGLGGEADEADHHRTGTRTQQLYEATFGEAYIRLEEAYAVTEFAPATAQNDRSYSVASVSGSAKMAWCETAAQNARTYSLRSVSGAANMAWCETAAQNARSYTLRSASGSAKMAWCETAAHPVLKVVNAAWCETVAQNDRTYSASPVPGSAKTAWCETVAQNDRADLARPMLAIAA